MFLTDTAPTDRPLPEPLRLFRLFSVLVAVLLGLAGPAMAATPSFKHILPDEVSALGYINSIAQDDQGFMWFAGANGLGRYDGYELKLYHHDPNRPEGLSHNYVNQILPAEGGDLWLATRDGVDYFNADTGRFSHHRHPDEGAFGSSVNDVRGLVRTEERLWIASRGGLLSYHLTANDYRHLPLPDAQADLEEDSSIWAVARDQNGQLWLGTQKQGVYRFNPRTETMTHFAHREEDPRSISDNDVREVYVDDSNQVWFGTYGGGLARYDRDNGDFVRYPNDNHEKSTTIWDIIRDSDGQYWVGDGSAINRFDPQTGQFEGYSYVEGRPQTPGNHVINVVYEDRQGDIWVGYFPAGVDRIDKTASTFNNYAHDPLDDNSITDGGVVSAHEDPQGDLWIGTGFGLNHWDRQSGAFTRITRDENRENTLSGNTILAIEQQGRYLWLGIWSGGLNRMDLETGEIRHYRAEKDNPKSLPGDEPWGLTLDHQGRLWVATDAGLARYNRQSDDFTVFQPSREQLAGDSHLYARVVYEDSRHNLWVGGVGGLYRLDEESGQFTHYHQSDADPDSLSNNFVRSLHEDSRGNLWVGTEGGGLNRFDYQSETFRAYTTEEGLADDTVTSIVEDEQGELWAATHQGLSRLDLEQEEFQNFSRQQGLIGNLFNRDASLLTRDGELFFGGSKGFTLFRPQQLKPNPHAPPVFITDIQVLNQSLPAVREGEGPGQSIAFADRITLQPDQSVVTFEYSALNYRSPENNRYAYRLLGFENDWHRVGNKRTATYTNLDPGEYRFQVKAANNDGLWNDKPRTLRVGVEPALWQTGWAYALYALALTGLMGWLVHTQRQKLAQERKVVQRLQQVDELKDDFLANTSHELRTPLNGIIGLSESLLDGATGELPDATRSNLAMIVASGRRLAGLVDDILDFAKLRDQGIELHPRPVDLHVVVEVVLTLTRPLVGAKPITLINRVPPELEHVCADEDRLLQILHNLVGNAVKFTERGQIEVTAQALPATDEIRFSVSDTGPGIAPRELQHLFEAFRQASGTNARLYGGTGLGLSITHQLVTLHGGQLTVDSEPGNGSTFTVTLPSARNLPHAEPAETATPPTTEPLPAAEVAEAQVALPDTQHNSGAHILVVDDEPVNRQVLANYLTLGNYRVSEADSGESALNFIEQHPNVDLVLLDIMMPCLSGYETCRTLRKRYSTLELPVIFLTAKRQISDLVQAFEAGGNDFVSKPFSRDELLARVNTHLQFLDIHRNLDKKVAERTRELKRINQGLEQAQEETRSAYEQLELASITDPLTGLYNRRFLNQQLPNDAGLSLRGYSQWRDNQAPHPTDSDCLFLLVDIDHFKPVNDTYGHTAGDQVLESMSQVLREAMRETDYLVRWGGEEFLLVARFSNRADAPNLAERVRTAVENTRFDIGRGKTLHKTCSIGYAAFPFYQKQPELLSWEQVIDTADRALYAAKRVGRNCWVGLEEGTEPPDGDPNPGTSETLEKQIERGQLVVRCSAGRVAFGDKNNLPDNDH
ncbi:two-component regulator propeller domain-containing protein [Marinimicrobium locisalis]|uniref:two-component regulator propeller domain-containing protein n=1 Tax=Marinimicrobium locisalis TaxID=546022 RepID=UPI003221CAF6